MTEQVNERYLLAVHENILLTITILSTLLPAWNEVPKNRRNGLLAFNKLKVHDYRDDTVNSLLNDDASRMKQNPFFYIALAKKATESNLDICDLKMDNNKQ